MARARNIKPAFFVNDDLAECSLQARLLFIGLWTLADRDGRLLDKPRRIKVEVFPYDDVDVNACLDELAQGGFIIRYVADGQQLIWIPKFSEHQNPHKNEKASELPAYDPTQHHASTVQAPCKNGSGTGAIGLIPDSGFLKPIADSVNRSGRSESSPSGEGDQEDLFDSFWEPYPRKVGKEAARKAFGRLPKPTQRRVLEAVRDYGASPLAKKSDRDLIVHPATWLNEGRYDDDRAEWQHPLTRSGQRDPPPVDPAELRTRDEKLDRENERGRLYRAFRDANGRVPNNDEELWEWAAQKETANTE